jgi:hypothetical protein
MRLAIILLYLAVTATGRGQTIAKKDLLITLGGGACSLALKGDSDLFHTRTIGGTIDFAFNYSITDRFAMGFHYQRLGTDDIDPPAERVRITRYEIEVGWRAWSGAHSALQITAGAGAGVPAISLSGGGLPLTAVTGEVSLGARYVHLLTDVIGAYALLNATPGKSGALLYGDQEVRDVHGNAVQINWSAVSLAAGVMVRF